MSCVIMNSCRSSGSRRIHSHCKGLQFTKKMIHTQGVGLFGVLGHGLDLKDSKNYKMLHKADVDDVTIVAKQISAGWGHSAGVTENGDLFVWGRPYDFSNLMTLNKIRAFSGILARFASRLTSDLGTEKDGLYPTPYLIESLGKVSSAHCSAGLTVVLTESGDLYSFGQNQWGQCGSGESAKSNTYDPQEVIVNMKIRSVDTGLQHCIALSKQGNHVLVWGKAINGQLGVTDHYQEYHAAPQIVRGLVGLISEVSAGFNHSAALTADGAVYVWGKGMSRILKMNARKARLNMLTYEDQMTPRTIEIPGGRKAVGMMSSNYTLIIRCDDNSMWAMGSGEYDRLSNQNLLRVQQSRNAVELHSDGTEIESDKNGNPLATDPWVVWPSSAVLRKGFTRVAILSPTPDGLSIPSPQSDVAKKADDNFSPTYIFEVVINAGEAYLKEKTIIFEDDERRFARGRRIIDFSSGWQHSIVLLEKPESPSNLQL